MTNENSPKGQKIRYLQKKKKICHILPEASTERKSLQWKSERMKTIEACHSVWGNKFSATHCNNPTPSPLQKAKTKTPTPCYLWRWREERPALPGKCAWGERSFELGVFLLPIVFLPTCSKRKEKLIYEGVLEWQKMSGRYQESGGGRPGPLDKDRKAEGRKLR